jgi:dolichyldiphosphatase
MFAVASLLPVLIVSQLVALILVRRDVQTMVLLLGLLLNVLFNNFLKLTWRQPRPYNICTGIRLYESSAISVDEEYGMPSNHGQFMAFFAVYTTLFLFFRVKAGLLEQVTLSSLSFISCVLVGVSRVYLNYHSTAQVLVSVLVGTVTGATWFGLYLRHIEALGQRLVKSPLAKLLRIRDTSHIANVSLFEYQSTHPEFS